MSAYEALQSLLYRTFHDEDGEPFTISLLPPCTEAEIARFAADLPCPLPPEIRELLAFTRGFRGGPVEGVDFLGDEFGPEGVFTHPIAINGDGFGNYWVLDITPETREWGPVYFWCHDPPVIAYQCATLTDFLIDIRQMCESPQDNPIDAVSREDTMWIWTENPGLIPQPEAAVSSDAELRDFAHTLKPDWLICDLRNPKPGEGFSWGRREIEEGAGHETRPIFAYRMKPKRGVLERLGLGGRS